MIFDFFIGFCFFQICFLLSLAFYYLIFSSTEEYSLWRMLIHFGDDGGFGNTFTVAYFYPTIFFLILLPLLSSFYSSNSIPTDIFIDRHIFVDYAKENWGKILFVWFISGGIAVSILEGIVKNKRKEK